MIEQVKVGETVIYTGVIKSLINNYTESLLKTFFYIGKECKVTEIGITSSGVRFYRFEKHVNLYPCESFSKSGRLIMSIKYDLR